MIEERTILRIGGLSAMLGVVLAVIAAMLGPMNLDSQDIPAVLRTFAANTDQLHVHGLGVTLGTLLILGAFVALYRSMPEGKARAWASLGLVVAVVKTVIHLVGAMMGGSVMPALGEAYALAPVEEAPAALLVGKGFYIFYEALLAPTFLTLAATILLFAVAVLSVSLYPAWLGWAALVPGIWTAAGGVAFLFAGPIGAADIMLVFVPGFMLAMAWVFVVGWHLWRLASALRTPSSSRQSSP
jgi:hypothetical protein